VQADTKGKGKAINPQWSPDGESLYFISIVTGVERLPHRRWRRRHLAGNHHRHRRERHHRAQPRPLGGIAHGTLAFPPTPAALQHLCPAGHGWRTAVGTAARRWRARSAQRRTNEAAALLENPSSGLPPPEVSVEPYSGKLKLESVMQPTVGVGVSRFGTRSAAASRLQRHAPQPLPVHRGANGSTFGNSPSVKDIGAQVFYFN
jgi:hypothetical protein